MSAVRALFRCVALVVLAVTLVAACGSGGSDKDEGPYRPQQESKTLAVTPIAQQTEVWCWAASAEMVFRHYGLPNLNPAGNYQCGIVAAYYGPYSACWSYCFACVSAIGPISQMQALINGYGAAAAQFTSSRVLGSTLLFSPLSFADIAREIDAGRPIVAGISPGGFSYPNISQHVVVIVGYRDASGRPLVVVNDPFPYAPSQDPYLLAGAVANAPGQYFVPYDTMISAMQWGNTIYQIQ